MNAASNPMPSPINAALERLIAGSGLSRAETRAVFDAIMAGDATPAQIGAVLMGLRMHGESAEEIAGAAEAMRALSTKVAVDAPNLVDTCGTGGSGAAKLFNVSTAAAFVAAGAGAHVAKHGNRGVTSQSGSADALEALGVSLNLTPAQIARCIEQAGIGFMFAPTHHSAMRHAAPVRRELGVRTVFNLLGPLTNPAGAKRQLIGVFSPEWQRTVAEVAGLLGAERALVVHADGLDELSIAAPSHIVELDAGAVREYDVAPEDFGLSRHPVDALRAASPAASAALIRQSLASEAGAAAELVALNAGAAIYAAGIVLNLADGVAMAQDVIATGQARERLAELVRLSNLMAQA